MLLLRHWPVGAEAKTGFKVSGWKLRLSQAVVLRGTAFWPLDNGALGVRLGPESTMEPHLLPYCVPHCWPEKRLLGVSPDNRRLFFIYFGVGDDILVAKISYFAIDGDDISSGRQEGSRLEEAVLMHQMKMTRADPHVQDTLKLRWFCDMSGLVLFTLGQGSGHNGIFALNLQTRMVNKVADGECDSWKNIVGYEMDMAAYLASAAHRSERKI